MKQRTGAPGLPNGRETQATISDKAAALALTPVSRETEARLERYVGLLREWQDKTNLVADRRFQIFGPGTSPIHCSY